VLPTRVLRKTSPAKFILAGYPPLDIEASDSLLNKCRLPQAGHLWLKHKDKEGTRKLVDREVHNALDSTGGGEVAYDSDSDTEVHPLQRHIAVLTTRCLGMCTPGIGHLSEHSAIRHPWRRAGGEVAIVFK